MAYNIAGHALLSADANALESGTLTAQLLVAQRVLGLSGTDYTGTAKQEAEGALAMQVSLQVAQDPEAFLAKTVTRGSRTITYRDAVPIHPLALDIAERLFAEDLDGTVVYPRGSATVPLNFGF